MIKYLRIAGPFLAAAATLWAQEGPSWKPFLGEGERGTLRARDFGAVPDDSQSDSEAIQKCLDAAIATGKPAEIVFEKGRYVLDKLLSPPAATSPSQRSALFLENVKDLVFRCAGAVFELPDFTLSFARITNCERIFFDDLSVELTMDPFLSLRLVSLDSATGEFVAELEEGTSPDVLPALKKITPFGYFLDDKIPGRLRAGVPTFFTLDSIDLAGERRVRGTFRKGQAERFSGVPAGTPLVVWARGAGGGGFRFNGGSDNTVRKFTATRLNGSAVLNLACSRLAVIECEARIAPGKRVSHAADFVHCQAVRQGPWIEGCHVEGIGDDSLVIYTRPYAAVGTIDGGLAIKRLYDMKSAGKLLDGELAAGDSLVFVDPPTGKVLGRATVTAWDPDKSEVKLSNVPEGIVLWKKGKATQIYNENQGNDFLIRNNTVKNNRRYGMYLKASNGLIEGNKVIGQCADAITLHNEPNAPNGPFCQNVTIRNNVIEDCGFDGSFREKPEAAVLSVYSRNDVFEVAAPSPAHRNIRIIGNTLKGWGGYGISVINLEGGEVTGNRLVADPSKAKGILTQNTKDVPVENNVWDDAGKETAVVPVSQY